MEIKTWLPVFQGFYNTMWEPDLDQVFQETVLNREELDEYYRAEQSRNENEVYEEDVAQSCVGAIAYELKNLDMIEGLDYEAIRRPKEYNFVNDSINITVRLSHDNIHTIKIFLLNNYKAWGEYLKDNFTSRSGFHSFHENTPEGEQWDLDSLLRNTDNTFDLGAVFEFVLQVLGYDADSLYQDTYENYYYCDEEGFIDSLIDRGFYTERLELLNNHIVRRFNQLKADTMDRLI